MKVIYNSRRANDSLIERAKKSGRAGGITFGQRRDPCVGIFGKVCCSVQLLMHGTGSRKLTIEIGNECLPPSNK
jgi:hypothetical protein